MIDLGLTDTEAKAYYQALRSNHRIRLDVRILDSDEQPIGNASYPRNIVLGGQVNMDVDAEVTRTLELELLDPDRRLAWTPNNAAQGAVYAENMISVRYQVEVEEIDEWVEVPIFKGPIMKYSHDGGIVRIEAWGKESLAIAPNLYPQGFTLRKGLGIDDAIKNTMRKVGERRFNIPPMAGMKLAKEEVIKPGSELWKVVQGGEDETEVSSGRGKLDGLINMTDDDWVCFYDGRGKLTARRRRKPMIFKFTENWQVTEPTLSYDIEEFRNWVHVRGTPRKGEKKQVFGIAALPPKHPLSPKALARNGDKRHMALYVKAKNIHTNYACKQKAQRVLNNRSEAGVEVGFEAVPVPHLEEWDMVSVDTEHGNVKFPLRAYTIPLTASDTMSIGFNKRVRQYGKGSGKRRDAAWAREKARRRRRKTRRKKKSKSEKK